MQQHFDDEISSFQSILKFDVMTRYYSHGIKDQYFNEN